MVYYDQCTLGTIGPPNDGYNGFSWGRMGKGGLLWTHFHFPNVSDLVFVHPMPRTPINWLSIVISTHFPPTAFDAPFCIYNPLQILPLRALQFIVRVPKNQSRDLPPVVSRSHLSNLVGFVYSRRVAKSPRPRSPTSRNAAISAKTVQSDQNPLTIVFCLDVKTIGNTPGNGTERVPSRILREGIPRVGGGPGFPATTHAWRSYRPGRWRHSTTAGIFPGLLDQTPISSVDGLSRRVSGRMGITYGTAREAYARAVEGPPAGKSRCPDRKTALKEAHRIAPPPRGQRLGCWVVGPGAQALPTTGNSMPSIGQAPDGYLPRAGPGGAGKEFGQNYQRRPEHAFATRTTSLLSVTVRWGKGTTSYFECSALDCTPQERRGGSIARPRLLYSRGGCVRIRKHPDRFAWRVGFIPREAPWRTGGDPGEFGIHLGGGGKKWLFVVGRLEAAGLFKSSRRK